MQEMVSGCLTAALVLWALVLFGSLIVHAAKWQRLR
jgi:hypothetical protein